MARPCSAAASMLVLTLLARSAVAAEQTSIFQQGDSIEVSLEGAPLQVGSDVRARLRHGEPLRVLGVRQDWIWTSIQRDGREIKGWIHAAHVRSRRPQSNVPPHNPAPSRADPAIRLNRLGAKLRLDEGGEITAIDFEGKRVPPAVLPDLQQLNGLRELNLSYCGGITDDSLRTIGSLESLESLDLAFCSDVTDAGLERLRSLTNLRHLNLSGTAVTDAGLAHLGGLAALEQLDLSGSLIRRGAIDGRGLHHLKDLTKLRRLSLYNTFVEDAGLDSLQGLTSLEALNIGDTWITSDGLSRLQPLKQLRELRLAYCAGIDDNALEILAKLRQLSELDLTFCRITDAGAEHLTSAKELRRLVLTGTRVTETGEARLAAALSDCKIER